MVGEEEEDDPTIYKGKKSQQLAFHGNERTMNLNPLILTNIQGSPYFKVDLFGMKTYHEVVDEIYYKVEHLEPWERGSRKTAGMSQTGMCGGVRGVSVGGIVSSAFCLLYKLYTLKLTKKQVTGLINHRDSPYIRGLGFMYLRFTQPPANLWDWFEPYMEDEEEIDVKAGGGKSMTMGDFCKLILTKLEWFETRFPRIPVNVEKMVRTKIDELAGPKFRGMASNQAAYLSPSESMDKKSIQKERSNSETKSSQRSRSQSQEKSRKNHSVDRYQSRDRSRDRDRSRGRDRSRDRSRDRTKSKEKYRSRDRSYEKDRKRNRSRSKRRDRSRDRKRERSQSRDRGRDGSRDDYAEQLRRFKDESRRRKERRSRSRSRDRR